MEQINPGRNNTAPYKKFDNVWLTQQTKKKRFVTGGSLNPFKVRSGKSKKWKINPMRYAVKNPLKKSTKKWYNPRRYLAFTQTKKKRELRAQRRDESHVAHKLYYYKELQTKILEYDNKKTKLKTAGLTDSQIEKEPDIQKIKNKIRALGNINQDVKINSSYIKKIGKLADAGIAKYSEKKKYYEDATDKLKHDSVEFIKNRAEYIKNGKPELTKKLDSLTTHDPTKMAIIRVPGQAPKAVNKLKYSDFKVDDIKVTDAYLDQFKTVNESIIKINKDFNIDHLSPERRIELARELHKITVDGIYDPDKQEKHFLTAVTEIAYKDKYYNALDAKSKDESFEYLKAQGPISIPKDVPELTLKQQRDLLAKRLTYGTVSEHQEVRKRLTQLDAQLKLTPDIINAKRQVLERQLKVLPVTNPKYQEIQDEIERLKLQAEERIKTQKQVDAADTELINKNITALTQKISGQNIDENRDKLDELNEMLSDTTINERRRKLLQERKARITERIKNYEDTEYAISVYKELLPENRDKYMKYDVHELQKIYNALTQNKQDMYKLGDPQLHGIYESYLSNLKNMLDLKRSQYLIEKNGDLTPSKRTILLSKVGPNFHEISTAADAIKK